MQVRFHGDVDGSSLAHAIYAPTGPLQFEKDVNGVSRSLTFRRHTHTRAHTHNSATHTTFSHAALSHTCKPLAHNFVTHIFFTFYSFPPSFRPIPFLFPTFPIAFSHQLGQIISYIQNHLYLSIYIYMYIYIYICM